MRFICRLQSAEHERFGDGCADHCVGMETAVTIGGEPAPARITNVSYASDGTSMYVTLETGRDLDHDVLRLAGWGNRDFTVVER